MTPPLFEILKPAKHGYTLDLTVGARRCHLRLFEFETQDHLGIPTEMPVTIDERHLLARLLENVEQLREHLITQKQNAP